jgi:hypothetical protein
MKIESNRDAHAEMVKAVRKLDRLSEVLDEIGNRLPDGNFKERSEVANVSMRVRAAYLELAHLASRFDMKC